MISKSLHKRRTLWKGKRSEKERRLDFRTENQPFPLTTPTHTEASFYQSSNFNSTDGLKDQDAKSKIPVIILEQMSLRE